MNPQDETLSPGQQHIIIAAFLAIFLVVSSFFAYAYVRGAQVRKTRTSARSVEKVWSRRFSNLRVESVKRRCIAVTQGADLQIPVSSLTKSIDMSRVWTINKFSKHGRDGSRLRPCIISYITLPGEWRVSSTGIISIPRGAEPGFYHVHYWSKKKVRDYFFEVTGATNSR